MKSMSEILQNILDSINRTQMTQNKEVMNGLHPPHSDLGSPLLGSRQTEEDQRRMTREEANSHFVPYEVVEGLWLLKRENDTVIEELVLGRGKLFVAANLKNN